MIILKMRRQTYSIPDVIYHTRREFLLSREDRRDGLSAYEQLSDRNKNIHIVDSEVLSMSREPNKMIKDNILIWVSSTSETSKSKQNLFKTLSKILSLASTNSQNLKQNDQKSEDHRLTRSTQDSTAKRGAQTACQTSNRNEAHNRGEIHDKLRTKLIIIQKNTHDKLKTKLIIIQKNTHDKLKTKLIII